MYEEFFKLNGRPFLAAPCVARYFPATAIETARHTLIRVIERGEGAGLVTGPSGTGKTLLGQVLAEEFSGRFEVATLAGGRLDSRRTLLQAILYELGQDFRGRDEGELRLTLLDHIESSAKHHGGLLLVVDEAHTLSWRLLEEIRLMTNYVRDGQTRVRVILAGSSLLEEHFASPKMTSFAQRVAARCYLEPLNATETAAYAQAQVTAVGGDAARVFDAGALGTVYQASDGVPRVINQLCDHALVLASLGGVHQLTTDTIEEAWADLQQVPLVRSNPKRTSSEAQIIEFGDLDDLAAPMAEATLLSADIELPDEGLQIELNDPLDAIAGQLHAFEEEFRPAGKIGTEVDLDFPEFGDPFGEQFAEEEVVLDRYAPEYETLAGAQRVESWEGAEIGPWLQPSQLSFSRGDYRQQEYLLVVADLVDPMSTYEVSPCPIERGYEVQDTMRTPVWSLPPSQEDVIVVEDEPRIATVWPTTPQPPKKRAYSQLFAKLRRG